MDRLHPESMVKCQNVHMCRTFMEELSGNVAGQGMMMRFLLEGMLSKVSEERPFT